MKLWFVVVLPPKESWQPFKTEQVYRASDEESRPQERVFWALTEKKAMNILSWAVQRYPNQEVHLSTTERYGIAPTKPPLITNVNSKGEEFPYEP